MYFQNSQMNCAIDSDLKDEERLKEMCYLEKTEYLNALIFFRNLVTIDFISTQGKIRRTWM